MSTSLSDLFHFCPAEGTRTADGVEARDGRWSRNMYCNVGYHDLGLSQLGTSVLGRFLVYSILQRTSLKTGKTGGAVNQDAPTTLKYP